MYPIFRFNFDQTQFPEKIGRVYITLKVFYPEISNYDFLKVKKFFNG